MFDRNGWNMFSAEGRNFKNTNRYDYNCGGYALGLYNWFHPYEDEISSYAMTGDNIELLNDMVCFMLKNIKGLRKINTCEECDDKKEVVVAFRIGGYDFHFMRRGKNHIWYQKMGWCPTIEKVPKEEVFSKSWNCRYNSPMVLFALKI